jgi:hypothetical protein
MITNAEADRMVAADEQVRRVIAAVRQLAVGQLVALQSAWAAGWNPARDDAWNAVWDGNLAGPTWDYPRLAEWDSAAWGAAQDAGTYGAWDYAAYQDTHGWDVPADAARGAVAGLLARDLIAEEQYDLLTGPWVAVIGPLHPDGA